MSSMLAGLTVLELGSRLGAGACGRLLADLGATVFVAEPRAPRTDGKWVHRALATAGRSSVLFDPKHEADVAFVADLAGRCDVVVVSSDRDVLPATLAAALRDVPIVCDVTAFGGSGPLAGRDADDAEIQAMTGLMHTTGRPSGPPAPIGVPVTELSAGLYAAAAVCLAWRAWRRDGVRQGLDIALYDTAFNALTTFLPAHFAGKAPGRLGNGHSMAVPWNAYRAVDGWVLICSASDQQWRKLAGEIEAGLADAPRYAALADRIALRDEVDERVAAWVATQHVAPLVGRLNACGIASGEIVPIDGLAREPNLAHRGTIVEVRDPVTGADMRVPGSLVRVDGRAPAPPSVPVPDGGRATTQRLGKRVSPPAREPRPPLMGVRVIEIGQFTTAPLAARHLASFGADVIKVEPQGGDSARAWAPHRDGTSLFFVLSNGTKRSAAIDLGSDAGRAAFATLVAGADVLVENMKPGSLARLGFSPEQLRSINPRLVYCAISGFGADSAYSGRPAFDTVVQAMSGMMDATRVDGVPMKSGISAADIGGGQTGLLAIVAALVQRDRTGRGATIDIAMQGVGAWLTQLRWNGPATPVAWSGPVATVAEACAHPQTLARGLIVTRRDEAGTPWELLGSPLRLSATPATIGAPLGQPQPEVPAWLDDDIGGECERGAAAMR